MKVKFSIQYNTVWGEGISIAIAGRKYPMEWSEGNVWWANLDVPASELKSYGYVLMRDGLVARQEWRSHSASVKPGTKIAEIRDSWIDCPIPGCPFPREHQVPDFDRPGFRAAGVAVPVFSLRTASDFGIGEFLDLKAVVDWAAATGLKIIQLLPVTDTIRKGTWKDSYPYSPVSSFALHPLYINLQAVGVEADEAFLAAQKKLNAKKELDFPAVFKAKMALLRKAFAKCGQSDMSTPSFKRFCKENGDLWLSEYSQFCADRDGDSPEFWQWVQWHLDTQFLKVVKYARGKGVYFKGDLPIGVSADSADAYWHPQLFNLDSSAGAPPDMFSDEGQCWGFPTYNWDEMSLDDYAWWKARLRHMSRYFDAYRIDHILGFFRIWEIPVESGKGLDGHFNPAISFSGAEISSMYLPFEGLFLPDPRREGYWQPRIKPDTSKLEWWQKERFDALYTDFFYHRNDEFWRRSALRKLPELLSATGMLACGEDLGMVPDCVPGVMRDLGILSLEMAMMEKGRPWPVLSVCATSSHDSETLRMQYARSHDGADMPVEEVRRSLEWHLNSDCMLAVFPLQDYLALDAKLRLKNFDAERINEPANPNHHWRYRVHFDLEKLSAEDKLNSLISGMVAAAGRK